MSSPEFRSFIEVVRSRIRIEEVVSQHVDLRHNKGICPFHEEKTPSLTVNEKGQYFHCFGCGIGGDVFRFLELIERKPFGQVLAELASTVGLESPKIDPSVVEEWDTIQQKRRILTLTAQFYHRALTPEVKSYLHERGFTDETISRFQIGYASGRLREYLLESENISTELAIKAGVLKESDGKVRDYFYKRIVFPNVVRGQVVHLTGRAMDQCEPKYLHLPGSIDHLYNEDDARSDEVVVCEGVPDCLTALQAGFKAVGIYGTSQLNSSHAGLFSHCQTVYICMDGDGAGRAAAERIGEFLQEKAVVVAMPDGTDVNEFFSAHGKDEFHRLIDSGRPYLRLALEKIEQLPEHKRLNALREFLPKIRQVPSLEQGQYVDRIGKKFGLKKKAIEYGIWREASTIPTDEPPAAAYSKAEKETALALLQDPELLVRLNDVLDRLGLVGEESNKVIVYFTLTSRLLESPINLIVKGDSSGGKSFLVNTITQIFPADQILAFTTISPKALYHRQDSLAHKVLIIYEQPGAEESDYSIRTLQSEKKLVISTSVKDPDTNAWVTEDHEVQGPIAYIATTTQSHLHNENETRCFELYVDDSDEQTGRIHEAQRRKYRGEAIAAPNLRPWIVAQQLLKPYPVIIPFVNLIKFPNKPVRVRRDHQRFLTLIETSAVLHQFRRDKREIDGTEYLIADIEDYAIAYNLASTMLQTSIRQLSPKAEKLAVMIAEAFGTDKQRFTRRELKEKTKWDLKTVIKHLKELEEQGLVELKTGRPGTTYEYMFLRLPDERDNFLTHPNDLIKETELAAAKDLGKPRETGFGQVNPHIDNRMTQPIQLDHPDIGDDLNS